MHLRCTIIHTESTMLQLTTKQIVAQYDYLQEMVEYQEWVGYPRAIAAWRAELAAFLERYPAVDDYDSEGNYIGTVRNENGWTP